MAPRRTFYRTTIEVVVLSEEPIPDRLTLEGIAHEIIYGDYSGKWNVTMQQKISGKTMANDLIGQGSDPAFFMLTVNGEDLDEEGGDDAEE